MYGDAIWETSNSGNGANCSWNGDYSYMPYSSYPFFYRGGGCADLSNSGLFVFYGGHFGISSNVISFRPVFTFKS